MGRSLAGFGLLALVAALGTGCGGGTKYNSGEISSGGSTPDVVTPTIIADAPLASTRGTRGTVPVALYPQAIVTTQAVQYFPISPTERARLSVPTTSLASVPFVYADRQFDHWELNGTQVSASANLTLSSLPATLSGALKAVYTPYNPGAGVAFTPNYNQDDNPRWPSMPVKVYIEPAIVPSEGVRQRLIAGLDKWVKASGGVISYTLVPDDGTANITFRRAESLDFLGEGVQGVTYISSLPSTVAGVRGTILSADIYYTSSIYNVQNATDQRRYSLIVAHEFGHALGISSDTEQGHSPDPLDIMYFTGNDGVEQITASDIGTIANIYRAEYDAAATSTSSITRAAQTGGTPVQRIITCRMDMKNLGTQYDVSAPPLGN